MNNSTICFPHLGITLSNVGRYLAIGGFEIAYYGIVIACGMIAGVLLIQRLARKSGQSEDMYMDLCMCVLLVSIIGARAYYCVFSWEEYKDNILEIFNIRGGGLAIYGGILTGIFSVFVFAKVKKKAFGVLVDTISPGLVLGQIIGRWGNFFNREAFGRYTDSLFAMALPRQAVYQSDITGEMLENLKVVDGIEFIQVHPTFLYESVWNVGVLIILLRFFGKKKWDGQVFVGYLCCYGIGRFMIESLRTDQLLLGKTGMPVSMLLSGILILISLIIMLRHKNNI